VGGDQRFRGMIYFIRCGWLVKIGFVTRPWRPKFRWSGIEWPSPCKRRLVGAFMSYDRDELVLHKAFADLRVNEWFVLADSIADFVAAHCNLALKGMAPARRCALEPHPD